MTEPEPISAEGTAEIPKRETFTERIIEASARNKFLVFVFTIFAVAAGFYGLMHTPLDAIPDLSDVQVIVYTEWEGRSPDLVEDQITYPISTVFIAAPKVKFVRGESMFGKSFIYVIFQDGTDIYWARSRVIEYLNSVRGSLPEGVNPVIGPDATGVGWVYEYALVDDSGKHDLAALRSIQDWNLRYALASVKGVSEVAPVGGFVKQYQVDLDPNALVAYNIPLSDVVSAIKSSLPAGVRIVPTYDRSELIRRAIATLREKLIEESIVVALVCVIFLWHVRSSLVAIITLPVAIILAFIPMWWMNLTSNIMSLGGIAIAIGAMVDSAIIMIENAHKALEQFRDEHKREPSAVERARVIIAAAKSVGRSLFFALLVITVSFIPVFSLTAQEGRLFRPLAFTKTFSMFFAAFLGVTLVPVLMVLLIRGKITPEIKNPVNRILIWAYQPLANFVLRYRLFTLACAALLPALTIFPFKRLGSEFMPPLNEGTLLYMPTAIPGMSIAEAAKILQIQDRQLKKIPEAVTVFGKAGQADTPTDPAPLSMFETVVALKPPNQWRKGMTWDKLLAELNANIKTPGMANIFWMPIQTRYARDFRQDIDALKRVLVPTPTGAQVPISLLADIRYKTGPPSVRSENGKLVGFVYLDITTSDIDGYVRKASQLLGQRIQYPPGYYIQWAGQLQYLQVAKVRLHIVYPFS